MLGRLVYLKMEKSLSTQNMSEVVVKYEKSLVDIAIEQYNNITGLYDIISNNEYKADSDLNNLDVVTVDESKATKPKSINLSIETKNPPDRRVKNNQNPVDIALEHYGDATGLYDLIRKNNISVNDEIPVNQKIAKHNAVKSKVSNYYRSYNITVATGKPVVTKEPIRVMTDFDPRHFSREDFK